MKYNLLKSAFKFLLDLYLVEWTANALFTLMNPFSTGSLIPQKIKASSKQKQQLL